MHICAQQVFSDSSDCRSVSAGHRVSCSVQQDTASCISHAYGPAAGVPRPTAGFEFGSARELSVDGLRVSGSTSAGLCCSDAAAQSWARVETDMQSSTPTFLHACAQTGAWPRKVVAVQLRRHLLLAAGSLCSQLAKVTDHVAHRLKAACCSAGSSQRLLVTAGGQLT